VTGNAVSSNALTVRQFGTGNVFSAQTTTGSTALFVNAAGNVGVGTGSPASNFHIYGASPYLVISDSSAAADTKHWWQSYSGTNAVFYCANDANSASSQWMVVNRSGYTPQYISWLTGGAERMRIDSSGRLGIGTASPGNAFQVGAAVDIIYANNPLSQSNVIIFGNSPFKPSYTGTGGGGTLFINSTNANASNVGASIALGGRGYDFGGGQQHMTLARIQGVYTAGSAYNGDFVMETMYSGSLYERMRITNTGLVGIGTTNPGYILEISNSTSSTSTSFLALSNPYVFGFNTGLNIGSSIVYSSRWQGDGGSGVVEMCKIDGRKENSANYGDSYLAFQTRYETDRNNGGAGTLTEKMRLTSAGRLGIGTTNPSSNVAVDTVGIVRGTKGVATNCGSVANLGTGGTVIHTFSPSPGGGHALLTVSGPGSQPTPYLFGFVRWVGNLGQASLTVISNSGITATIDVNNTQITLATTSGTLSRVVWNITYLPTPNYLGDYFF
jgi:hypothetical protein